nr:zinc-binding dehydrogenase [Microlunatus antarcticus]
MLSDILPTGFEIGVRYGRVEPGDVDAVVDLDANRLEQAASFGATDTVTSGDEDWVEQVLALTDGLGVDVAIEAVGVPATFAACLAIVRPGGSVANDGVHGTSVPRPLQDLWIMDLSITTGLVSTSTTAMLLKLVAQSRLAVTVGRDLGPDLRFLRLFRSGPRAVTIEV